MIYILTSCGKNPLLDWLEVCLQRVGLLSIFRTQEHSRTSASLPVLASSTARSFPVPIFKMYCRTAQFFSTLGPVKTKRKVTVTSFTGIVTTNLVSHCSDGPFSTSSSAGSWGSSLPAHPSSRPDSQDKIQA